MIRIIYRTGEEELVPPKFLDILLYLDQVQMFQRADGWVVVGVDPLRTWHPSPHYGENRRRHKPTPLPPPVRRNFCARFL